VSLTDWSFVIAVIAAVTGLGGLGLAIAGWLSSRSAIAQEQVDRKRQIDWEPRANAILRHLGGVIAAGDVAVVALPRIAEARMDLARHNTWPCQAQNGRGRKRFEEQDLCSGRGWDRTSDPSRVKRVLSL
jgi:hypothetical protein